MNADAQYTPPLPFETYTRMVKQTKHVARVTAENIGQIAAIIGGQVDYSKSGDPVLLVPRDVGGHWRVQVGWHLGIIPGEPPLFVNASGYDRDGDWVRS